MERYIDLIHEHPQIEHDVPQKEIAEYLQIKLYNLSRIKKKIIDKNKWIFSKTYTQVYILPRPKRFPAKNVSNFIYCA